VKITARLDGKIYWRFLCPLCGIEMFSVFWSGHPKMKHKANGCPNAGMWKYKDPELEKEIEITRADDK
jgi:hypothetical protein